MKNCNAFLSYISAVAVGLAAIALAMPLDVRAQAKGTVIEEIVARVNNDAITLSDVQKADQSLHDEIGHDCQGCAPEKTDELYKEKQKDLLRDLIDQALLVERAKDMGISVDSDLVKRLDEIRRQNNLGSMEEMEKKVEQEEMCIRDRNQADDQQKRQQIIRSVHMQKLQRHS